MQSSFAPIFNLVHFFPKGDQLYASRTDGALFRLDRKDNAPDGELFWLELPPVPMTPRAAELNPPANVS